MKKLLQNPFFTTLLLLTLPVAVMAAPVEPVRTMVVCPVSMSTPLMDGILENDYGETQTTTVFNPTDHDGDADFAVSFNLCFDWNYLYVYAEITDDVEHNYYWNVGNPWEFDNIEIFMQLDTNTVTTSYGLTTIQLRICRGLDSIQTPGRAKRADYLYYMDSNAPGGWVTEVAVPWTAVLAEGSAPEDIDSYIDQVIGFDFAGGDSDNTDGDYPVGNRDCQVAWDTDDPDDPEDRTEDLAWNNTSVFGYVSLEDCWLDEWPIDALEDHHQEDAPRIYVDPDEEIIRFFNVPNSSRVRIIDMQGRLISTTDYHPGEELDISGLQRGLYVAVFNGKESVRFMKR